MERSCVTFIAALPVWTAENRGWGGFHLVHIDADDLHGAGDQFFLAAADVLAEDDLGAAQFFDFQADRQGVVEAGRLQVFAMDRLDHEGDALVPGEVRTGRPTRRIHRCGSVRKNFR